MNTKAETQSDTEGTSFAKRTLIATGVGASLILMLIFAWQAIQILLLLFAGVMVSVVLQGASGFISHRSRLSYKISLVLVILLIIGIVAGLVILLTPKLFDQAVQLPQEFAKAWDSLEDYLRKFQWGDSILKRLNPENIFNNNDGNGSGIGSSLIGIFSSTAGLLSSFVLIVLVGIYLAAEPDVYKSGLIRLIPKKRRERGARILNELYHILLGWLAGQFLSMTILGALMMTGLWFLDVPLALMLGLFMGLMTIIPYLGPIISGFPILLMALSKSPTTFFYAGILFFFAQNLEGYFLSPLVQRKVISLPPVLILPAQVLMLNLMGFLGILIATPLVACIMVLVQRIYIEDILGGSMETTPKPIESA